MSKVEGVKSAAVDNVSPVSAAAARELVLSARALQRRNSARAKHGSLERLASVASSDGTRRRSNLHRSQTPHGPDHGAASVSIDDLHEGLPPASERFAPKARRRRSAPAFTRQPRVYSSTVVCKCVSFSAHFLCASTPWTLRLNARCDPRTHTHTHTRTHTHTSLVFCCGCKTTVDCLGFKANEDQKRLASSCVKGHCHCAGLWVSLPCAILRTLQLH